MHQRKIGLVATALLPLLAGTAPVAADVAAIAPIVAQARVRGGAHSGSSFGHRRVVVPASSTEQSSDVGLRAHTNYSVVVQPVAKAAPAESARTAVGAPYPNYLVETPASLGCIYNVTVATRGCNPNVVTTVPTGGSKVIAIVAAYNLPTAANDLRTFSTQFGLPAPNLQVVFASGTQPTVNDGWAMEEALDIEMAHAMAPGAKIVLVEAASNAFSDLGIAIDAAYTIVQQAGGGQVSMSFGGSEFSGEAAFDQHFAKQGFVTFYAAAGDTAGTEYPSTSPNVVAVGGTSTSRSVAPGASFGDFLQETAWADTGGGLSSVFARPSYQNGIAAQISGANARAVPDISAVASNLTPVWIYCGSCNSGAGWYTVAGTSVATPLVAGMANRASAFRQNSAAALASMYADANKRAFFGVPLGVCGPQAGYFTSARYDLCTGLGAPRAPNAL